MSKKEKELQETVLDEEKNYSIGQLEKISSDKIHQRRARETRVAETLGTQGRNDSRDCFGAIRIHRTLSHG